jgi:hypothetical protein
LKRVFDYETLSHIWRKYPYPRIGVTWRAKFKTKKILTR